MRAAPPPFLPSSSSASYQALALAAVRYIAMPLMRQSPQMSLLVQHLQQAEVQMENGRVMQVLRANAGTGSDTLGVRDRGRMLLLL